MHIANKAKRRVALGAIGLAGLGLAAGCGSSNTATSSRNSSSASSGSISPIAALKGKPISVGSKEFTEQLILGEIAVETLKAAGADVQDKTNIRGTSNTRKALTSGQVDMYWEYTGTAWLTILNRTTALPNPTKQFNAVAQADAKNGIVWFDPAPLNDSYGLAVGPSFEQATGVKTISDMAKMSRTDPSKVTVCVETEFATRPDGLAGLKKTYAMKIPQSQVKLVDVGVLYTQAAKSAACNYAEIYTTDGRIESLKLTTLRDDKNFFPPYNPALTMRKQVFDKVPQVKQLFASVVTKLTTQTMVHLNAQVDVEGQTAEQVAHDWMVKEGFLGPSSA